MVITHGMSTDTAKFSTIKYYVPIRLSGYPDQVLNLINLVPSQVHPCTVDPDIKICTQQVQP
eukprot:SAG31_NODE_1591_length_7814_cov_4.501453_5_plen_62_part_00